MIIFQRRAVLSALLAPLFSTAQQALAQSHPHSHGALSKGGLVVRMPWTRATPPGSKVAGGYLMIENTGVAPDRLLAGTFDVAGSVEIHEMAMEAGVMRMRALEKGLEIAPGGKAELKPGGFHVMFLDLKRPLKEGESVKGDLIFEKAGRLTVEFKVMGIGARSAGGAHQH